MKFSYSFAALVLLLPMCIGYAYQSKKAWHQHVGKVEAQVETLPELVPNIPITIPMSQQPTAAPTSYQEALKVAKTTNKTVLLFFSGERFCQPCRQMMVTLRQPQVRQMMDRYVFYRIDVEGPEAIVARQKGIQGVPTYMILNSEEKVLKIGTGYKDANSFIIWLNSKEVTLIGMPIYSTNPLLRYQPYYGPGVTVWCETCSVWHYRHPVARRTLNALRWCVSPSYRYYIWCQNHYFTSCI